MSSQAIIHWNLWMLYQIAIFFVQLREMESLLVGSVCKFSIQDANMERSAEN